MCVKKMSTNLLGNTMLGRNRIIINNFCNHFAWSTHKSAVLCSCSMSTLNRKLTKDKYENSSLIQIGSFHRRNISSEGGPPSTRLPPLMNFPQIVWPSIIKSFRNFILSTFIIKPYMDHDFNLSDFVAGSKKALEVVSQNIADGNLKSLEGLVTNEVTSEIQQSVMLMSLTQREQIAVKEDDIYFSFPYQVGIIFDEETDTQKRFVEITMVYHALRGLAAMRANGEEPPLNMGMMPEYSSRISISNYRFIREFTKDVESDWTINLLNHFKPSDTIDS